MLLNQHARATVSQALYYAIQNLTENVRELLKKGVTLTKGGLTHYALINNLHSSHIFVQKK